MEPRSRRHKRIIKRLETEFSAQGIELRGISSDLSATGLFVRTNKPFSPETVVDLKIHLPGNSTSKLRGAVRRAVNMGQLSGKNGMGIEIIEADKNYIDFLNTLLPPEERVDYRKEREAMSGKAVKDNPATPAPPKVDPDAEEDTIDSMISSLFPKRGRE